MFVELLDVLTQVLFFDPTNVISALSSGSVHKEFEMSPLHGVHVPSAASKIPV